MISALLTPRPIAIPRRRGVNAIFMPRSFFFTISAAAVGLKGVLLDRSPIDGMGVGIAEGLLADEVIRLCPLPFKDRKTLPME